MSLSNLLRCLPVIAVLLWMHRFYSWMRLTMHSTVTSLIFSLWLAFLIIIAFKFGLFVIMWSTCSLSTSTPISDSVIRTLCWHNYLIKPASTLSCTPHLYPNVKCLSDFIFLITYALFASSTKLISIFCSFGNLLKSINSLVDGKISFFKLLK